MSKEGKPFRKRINSTRLPDDMEVVYRIMNDADVRKRKMRTKGGDSMGKIKKSKINKNLEPHKLFAKLIPKKFNFSKESSLKSLHDNIGKDVKQWHPIIKSTCLGEVNGEEVGLVKPIGPKLSEENIIDFIIEASNKNSNTIISHQNCNTFNEPVMEGQSALKPSEENITNFIIEGSNENFNTIIKHQNSKTFNAQVMEGKSDPHNSITNKANCSPVEVTYVLTEVTEPSINEAEIPTETLDKSSKETKLIKASTFKTCILEAVAAHPKIDDSNKSVISNHELETSIINCSKRDYSKVETSAILLTDNRPDMSCIDKVEKEEAIITRKVEPKVIDNSKGVLKEDVHDDDSGDEDSDNFSVATVLREEESTSMSIIDEQNLQEFDKIVDNVMDDNIVVLSEADSCSQDDNTAEFNASQQEVKTGEGNFVTFNTLFETGKQFSQTSVKEMPTTVQTAVVESSCTKTSKSPPEVSLYENESPKNVKENILENGIVMSPASEHNDAVTIKSDDTVGNAIVFCDTTARKVQRCLEVDNKHTVTKQKFDYGKSLKGCIREKEDSFEFDFEEFGISSSQLQQIENEYNENQGSGDVVASPQSGVRPPLQPMIPDAPLRLQIQTMPNMAWLQKMREEKQKLRAIIQEIAKINVLVLRARNEIWPKPRGSSAEGPLAQEVLRPQTAMAPPWGPAQEVHRPQTAMAPYRLDSSRPVNK